ncbi:ribosomal protein S7 [Gonapodya prolifera JEL478]|uniref:Ribosomal protein S7 n=1 Tax=Gonapodya prolifera (strain JEL478) TaxID=1344416 RepID=A0A139ACT8_GONPJ|nr:ribosomal protein S7 [Gonapodya prolifera JEL478]|eukprot:KXS14394.1 ribosomal protein S7 [Gonapodya prolifera JEL478]
MRHGRKSVAERLVSESLRIVQQRTNLNPVEVLVRAVDSVSPLVRLKTSSRGATRIATPWPLHERARRRTAVLWIKEAADKKKGGFPLRFANEVLAVIAGTSPALEKKANVHRAALQNRSNVILKARVRNRSG